MSEFFDVFKLPVYITKLNVDNDKLKKFCYQLRKKEKKVDYGSNVGGYHSPNIVKHFSVLSDLVIEAERHANIYIQNLDCSKSLKATNIWCNINGYKDSNIPHLHPKAFVSCVYYVQVPKNSGNIYFEHPAQNWMGEWTDGGVWKNFNNANSAEWTIPSETSQLLLFPGWLRHGVNPHLNKKEDRICFSMNFVVN